MGALVGGMAEKALHTTVVSWEMGGLLVPVGSAVGGLLVGTVAALSARWVRGLLIGLVASVLFCVWWLVGAWDFPLGVKVWAVAVWVTACGTAGAVSGVLTSPLAKKPHATSAIDPGSGER
jgi:hypothetical protein